MRDLVVFLAVSFGLAALLDFWFLSVRSSVADLYALALYGLVWGLLRMYAPTAGALLAIKALRRSVVEELKAYLGLGRRALFYFLLAPLVVYLAVGIYLAVGLAVGVVDLGRPVKVIVEETERAVGLRLAEDVARLALVVQIPFAYVAALSINAFFALGEELGWRGYLYRRLGSRPDLRTIFVVGVVWGLWHATAIGLLGHNYPQLRWAGVPLFVLYCVLLSAFMLRLVAAAKSVLPAASFHGAVNALWGLTVLFTAVEGAAGEALGGLGALGLAALAATLILLIAVGKSPRGAGLYRIH
ncbi:MAG: CPBP family intramembrane glutamic endopeptidase [Pyrobaculum sp.]|nr:CPBP family intramembrane glutamic endopeptidase [Pyrobaculum sp.]